LRASGPYWWSRVMTTFESRRAAIETINCGGLQQRA
jgi:hypothetical protein